MTRQRKFNTTLFLMAMLGVGFLLIFAYLPMFGIIIAFKDLDGTLNIIRGLLTKPFVGFENFRAFFEDRKFGDIMYNTIGLNLLQLILTFPAPILFAILLNEVRHSIFRRGVQTITYLPYFISWVVFGGIVLGMLSPESGILNGILVDLGILEEPIAFASRPEYFWWIVIASSVIKGIGWGTVIYVAAIAGIDPGQYEAATIDGANRFQRTIHVTLPGILGTIIVFLLLSVSNLLNSSFDQIYILQNPLNITRSEMLDTYVYKMGISQMRYSYTTAVGVFKSVVALILLSGSNLLSKRLLGRGIY